VFESIPPPGLINAGVKPDAHKARFKALVEDAGLRVAKGHLEIFPDSEMGRRLPFGDHQVFRPLKDGDDWYPHRIDEKSAQIQAFRDLPVIRKTISTFPSAPAQGRYTFPSAGAGGRYGSAAESLLRDGLKAQGTRHEAQKSLIHHFYRSGASEEAAYGVISSWYRSGRTNGHSKEKNNRGKISFCAGFDRGAKYNLGG